jgi:DNA (cytosine-5)-methyltransferase 1
MGLETAGWRCVGHAEWEAFPRRVLKHRWPEVPLWGDVSKLNGHDIVKEVGPFTMLTFGAPCQDFSIAGARAGMGGERSVLVLDALRIWEESGAPCALYENVVGMLSSNQGADFAGILSVFVGDSVAVPARGWKGGGGIVRGRRGVAAWRVLDAQYFGVPQRRRRVFVLGVRDGSVDPAQVLSLLEGVSGHPPTRRAKRQGAPADTGAGVAGSRTGFSTTSSVGYVHDVMPSLPHLTGLNCPGAQMLGVLAFDNLPQVNSSGIHDTITTEGARNPASVLTYDARGNGDGETVNTLVGNSQNRITEYTAIVVGVDKQQALPFGSISPTLKTDLSHQMGPVVSVMLRNREGKPGGGKGPLLSPERQRPLGTANDQVVFPTITMGAHPAAPGLNGQDAPQMADAILRSTTCGIPRRLTPVECERLMGWPDGWTDVPDEKGKPAPDTARYKACGNGVASPVAAWIGFRLREALEAGDA